MEPITIERNEHGGFTVRQGDRYSDGIAYEEMIGVVFAMTQPEEYLDRFRNWMRTEEEWRRAYPWMFRDEEEKPKETLLLEMKQTNQNKMEQTTQNTPQWIKDMQKWHKEDIEHRSVLCVATDNCGTHGILGGYSFPLIMALLRHMLDDTWEAVISTTYNAKRNPATRKTIIEEWPKFKKEHGFPIDESDNEESEKKSDLKSSLKNLLHTIADKL